MNKVIPMLFYSNLLVQLTLFILILVQLNFFFSPIAYLKLDLLTLLTSCSLKDFKLVTFLCSQRD
ncbi:hypothetical protein Goari_017666 [Gossypium aridum]|uniref:Uncharacterized protein n=1 Tax=Gossypium aridum TaxID=34290 RepID=A0A7J8WMP1_GOSAI|nr:hypothetical protein [Gossypium aridum]